MSAVGYYYQLNQPNFRTLCCERGSGVFEHTIKSCWLTNLTNRHLQCSKKITNSLKARISFVVVCRIGTWSTYGSGRPRQLIVAIQDNTVRQAALSVDILDVSVGGMTARRLIPNWTESCSCCHCCSSSSFRRAKLFAETHQLHTCI